MQSKNQLPESDYQPPESLKVNKKTDHFLFQLIKKGTFFYHVGSI